VGDLREYRVDERERQRACRARRRGQPGVALSRPGLSVEVPALERDLLEIVDRHVELSRAGLRREVARLLRFRGREVGASMVAGP
jgi:septum formation topological specificity factor MinE